MKYTDAQIRFLKANREMLISLFEYRINELAMQVLDTEDNDKSLQLKYQALEDKSWISTIKNYYNKKDKKEGNYTGI